MTVRIGGRIGVFEIAEPLGAGGMGEVYRARDTRLGRNVAIKVLPPSFAMDVGRRARFEREAQLLASLNHPNIATLHGIEDSPAGPVLVMELVDGNTLSDRIALDGRLGVREALTIAEQVAAALEAAHETGIIHRDLKPANIAVRADGTVKVLDFGLAKALAPSSNPAAPTAATELTDERTVVGTTAYMSPEQARGATVDRRTDIWAFGCVLYEMLAGRRAFEGSTGSDVLAAVIARTPDWTALPADTPVVVQRLLRRCLEKDLRERLRDIGDARLELRDTSALGAESAPPIPPRALVRRRVLTAALGALALFAGVAIGILAVRPAPTAPTSPLYVSMPFQGRAVAYTFGNPKIAISNDGSTVAFASTRGLQIRHIDQKDGVIISTVGNNPFFSPDGDWVGLFRETEILKVPVRGGTPVTIMNLTDRPFGAAWRPDGRIVFATTEGLLEVSANGGEPSVIARPERDRGERLYAWPHLLPGGESMLYTAVYAGPNDSPQTILLDLKSHERKTLVRGSAAVYVASGHLVYAAGAALNAIAFDAKTGAITGKPVPISGIDVATSTDDGAANFAVSDTGTLIFLPPTAAATGTFEWIDRHGRREPLDVEPQRYGYAMVSPDGTRVALERYTDGRRNIWILDLKRLTQTQLTDGPTEDNLPVWSADSQRVFFASNRSGNFDVYSQAADGASSATLVFAAPGFQAPSATTPDGTRLVIYDKFDDLAILNLAKPDHLEPLLHSGFDERLGQLSADGRWIAYESNESGSQFEIVLRSFPDVSARREIVSINGGRFPRWGPKGLDELYYLSPDGAMMAVPVRLLPSLTLGTPKKLFDWQKPPRDRSGLLYDVAPDGRFLMPKAQAPSPDVPTNVSLIVNWLADLRHTPRQ